MRIQLERIDLEMMEMGGGAIVSPFFSYWNDENGELLAVADGVVRFKSSKTLYKDLFKKISEL